MAPSLPDPFDSDATRVSRPADGTGASTGGGSMGGPSDNGFDAEATVVVGVLRPGEVVFGRYRLKEIVGRGGMGVVWSAQDEELDSAVALKFLPEIVARDAGSLLDLKRETRRSRGLTHAHIVRVHDFHAEGGRAAISMELLTGGTVADRLTQQREKGPGCFEVEQIRAWVRQVGEALAYAHEQGVVHRDLKPGNLLLDAQGWVKVADFGIAASLTDSVSRVSRAAGTSGTPSYMSPQQMLGQPPTVADDVYAFGATLYELLTGRPPFYTGMVAVQVLQVPAVPLSTRRTELGTGHEPIPPSWQETILSCLAKQPAERPEDVISALARLGLGAGSAARQMKIPVGLPPHMPDGKPVREPSPPSSGGRPGGLILDTQPSGAEVRIGGMKVAKAPLREGGLATGETTLTFLLADHRPLRQVVTIPSDEFLDLGRIQLEPVGGWLRVETDPPASTWKVIDGPPGAKDLGSQDLDQNGRVAVPVGKFRISATCPGYAEQRVECEVADGLETKVQVLLSKGGVQVGQEYVVPQVGIEEGAKPLVMMWIPSGTFIMGSPKREVEGGLWGFGGKVIREEETGRLDYEGPQTKVTLSRGFWLGKYEVTQAQWRALMVNNPAHFQNVGVNAPVENVSWDQVMKFCQKLSERERAAGRLPEGYRYTLPTEAQWEYAARAGTTGPYGGTGNLDDIGWYSANSGNTTKPVGQKRANAWGLHDMHGNVWEWCADWFGNYPGGNVTDPTGPASGTDRVSRGGSWLNFAQYCRSAYRDWRDPGNRDQIIGFRLALISSP